MLTTINIVIGLVFVLLLFSLLTSTVMEVIASILSLRARNLRYTMENMLGEKMDDFIRHPLFRQLAYSTSRKARISTYYLPAYISKDTFTAILQDFMGTEGKEGLVKKIESLDEGDLKRMMQFLLRQSGGNLNDFKEQTGYWFDEVMSRSSDWYKRNLKWWLFGVGFVLAFIFNVDTIQVYKNISSSATVQKVLMDMAENYSEQTDTVQGMNLNLPLEESIVRLDSALHQIDHIRSPLGLGWQPMEEKPDLIWWLVKLAGLLLTGISVTFGAPFWFDVLKKILSLRGNGGGSEKEPDNPKVSKPSPKPDTPKQPSSSPPSPPAGTDAPPPSPDPEPSLSSGRNPVG